MFFINQNRINRIVNNTIITPTEPTEIDFGTDYDYFVSATATGTDDGATTSTPWSLSQLSAASLSAGDKIGFKASDEFEGTITVGANGTPGNLITYGAYGIGVKPKFYGSEEVTGWTLHSGNIYKATFSTSFNQLFVDDTRMQLARYPSTGWHEITTGNSNTVFTSTDLDSGIDYTGATFFGRTNNWSTEVSPVASSNAQTITLGAATNWTVPAGYGFILMNKIDFLTGAGQWCYDSSTNTIYLWTPNGTSPSNFTVRVSTTDYGVSLGTNDYIRIENLEFLQQNIACIDGNAGSYREISAVDMNYPNGYGIFDDQESDHYTIENCTITGANHYGMEIRCSYSQINDNIIKDIADFNDIGLTGNGLYNRGGGMYVAGENGNNTIEYNRIDNVAYHGIYISKPNNLVQYNYISNVCTLKADGGFVYVSWRNQSLPPPTGTVIQYNIGLYSHDRADNKPSSVELYAHGFYADEESDGVTFSNNVSAHCSAAGYFIHLTTNCSVNNNLAFDNRFGIETSLTSSSSADTGNEFTSNTIVALDECQDNWRPYQMQLRHSGSVVVNFDYNTYVSHYNSGNIFDRYSTYVTFAEWQGYGFDANGSVDTSPLGVGETEVLFINTEKIPQSQDLSGYTWRDLDGNAVTTLTLQPYTGKILIRE